LGIAAFAFESEREREREREREGGEEKDAHNFTNSIKWHEYSANLMPCFLLSP